MLSRHRPNARTIDLVLTESHPEVLVYDQQRHHIHHLNDVARMIWRLCNGRRSIRRLASLSERELGIPVDTTVVRDALTKLHDANLLVEPLPPEDRIKPITRRRFTRGAAGAVAVIVSTSAPAAAASTSSLPCRTGETCFPSKGCCGSMECIENPSDPFVKAYWCM